MKRAGAAPRDQFLAGGWAVARYAWKHPHRYRLMFASPVTKRLEDLAAEPSDAPFGALVVLVEAWQAAGLLRAGDPFPIALTIFATTNGVATLFAGGRLELGARSAKALADRVHQDLLDGIGP
ncbi:MAG: TetR-like C-terminal domain-containing protein [Sandaracinaceae bacterium]